MDQETRAARWAQSLGPESDAKRAERLAAERDKRQEAHWERLHQQLYWLPLYFALWSLGITVVSIVLLILFKAL